MADMHISGHAPVYQTHSTSHAAGPQGTPEQYFANHMQDQYGVQIQQHNQLAVCEHAHQFASTHGMGDQAGMAQLNALVQSLMAEITLLKLGGAQLSGKPETAESKHMEEKTKHEAEKTRIKEKAEMKSEMKALQAELKAQSDLDDWILQNLT
jgi:hypothetical protein